DNANEINVTDLNEGVYFVRVSDKNGNSVVKKIVKK
ncbi:MAG: T9SS type A sorting domain-containing protein, partial [Bacteroidales bacterium]|nr:T9SS type A sorting domain-containing protein [Bacteroidales bacterium]